MLLPLDLVTYRLEAGLILPRWLGVADEPFAGEVLEAVGMLSGLSAREVEIVAGGALSAIAREAGQPPRTAEALWALERKRWDARIDAPVEPEKLRDVLFEVAARLDRAAAIAEAARRLRIAPEAVVPSLFADRLSRRVLVAPDHRSQPSDVVSRYNLAVVQSLLARSMELEATIDGDRALVVAAAKRDGLLARFEERGHSTRIELTGALGLFRDTMKYGRSIARFVPAILAAPEWSLRARVVLGSRTAELRLDRAGAAPFPSVLPAAPDGRLARRIARALRRSGIRVDLQPALVRAPPALLVPDFALEWGGRRVLVDVVPFATPDYLARKAEAVRAAGIPLVVCVDERYASLEAPWILPYKRDIDAWALLAAAQRLTASSSSPSSSSSSSPWSLPSMDAP